MPTSTERADAELDRLLRKAPARVANASRNANAGRERHRRWEPARDALWDFVAPLLGDGARTAAVGEGARVAVVGAGNCDSVPLRRLVGHAAEVTLIDIDPRAAESARRRLGRRERRKVEAIGHDVTEGAADAICAAALTDGDLPADPASRTAVDLTRGIGGKGRPHREVACDPLPGAPYDLVIGDLFYSQLLYPALLDLAVPSERIDATIAAHGPALTTAVVARLHASAPVVVHVHDPLAWWDGHEQSVVLEEVLDLAETVGPDAALALVARGIGPKESDPRAALPALGLAAAATALWPWPFREGVDYLACATLAMTAKTTFPDHA